MYDNVYRSGMASILCALLVSSCAIAGEIKKYTFDAALLSDDEKNADLTLFENGTQLPGTYIVDVILNGRRVDSREMVFHNTSDSEGKEFLVTCVTKDMLIRYGVKVDDYPELFKQGAIEGNQEKCADFDVIPQAKVKYDFAGQQLFLSIPQVALRSTFSGIAPEGLWDDGIPAFLLNWQANADRTEYRNGGGDVTNSAWVSLAPGMNIGPWRIRNLTTWNKSSHQEGKWESAYSRVERGINRIKSRLVLGETYSSSDIFDSVPFRGVSLYSDDSMLPYDQRRYSPVVRGIARSQAKIEVRQNGYLIYSINVAPGAFALTDIPVTGSSGDLQVTIRNIDGGIQSFSVPYTTPAIALKEGYLDYSMNYGQYRPAYKTEDNTYFGQLTAMYGLPWGITVFGGGQAAEHYQSTAFGLGVSIGSYGAVSVDSILSRGQNSANVNESGYTWRVRYNKSFEDLGTFLSADYKHFSKGYRSLSDVMDSYLTSGLNIASESRGGYRATLGLSQNLDSFGYLGVNAVREQYDESDRHHDFLSASYNTTWRDISWSLGWSHDRSNVRYYGNNYGKKENIISFWMSVPLGQWLNTDSNHLRGTAQMLQSNSRGNTYSTGLDGEAFERQLQWGVQTQSNKGTDTNNRLDMAWTGRYGELSGSYSYSKNIRNINGGVTGGVVIHEQGITLGQESDNTLALVSAPGVDGAAVGNIPGVKTDFRGYTLVGNITPYQENVITLDPTTFSDDVEVPQTDIKVVPTKGAIVKADFKTRVGKRVLISLRDNKGKPLPFGTVITVYGDTSDKFASGVVGDHGRVYLSGLRDSGILKAQWGRVNQCYAKYNLTGEQNAAGVYLTHSVCLPQEKH